jgi:hypothetical protein
VLYLTSFLEYVSLYGPRVLSVAVKCICYPSLTIAGLVFIPVLLLVLYDITLYIARVVDLYQLSTVLLKAMFNLTTNESGGEKEALKVDNNEDKNNNADAEVDEKLKMEKVTNVRNSRGRISFRRTMQCCEQVIYENSVTH